MHDALLVHEIDPFQQSFHDLFSFDLAGESVFLQITVQRETQKFHNNVSGVFRFKNTFKFTDVFVV